MNEIGQAQREKYWEEKTSEQRIDKLGEVVEMLARRVMQLEKEKALLSQHEHASTGGIVIPLVHNEPEYPWYYSHILGREPKS